MTISKVQQIEIYCYLLELAAKTDDIAKTTQDRYVKAAHAAHAQRIREYANEFYKNK